MMAWKQYFTMWSIDLQFLISKIATIDLRGIEIDDYDYENSIFLLDVFEPQVVSIIDIALL